MGWKMNVRKYFEQYNYIPHEIESLEMLIIEQKELAASIKSIDYSKERVQVSTGNEADFQRRIEKAWEYEEKYKNKIDVYYMRRKTIENLIEEVTNPSERIVLKYKYINSYNNVKIADKLMISRQWVDELVARGLAFVEEVVIIKGITLH